MQQLLIAKERKYLYEQYYTSNKLGELMLSYLPQSFWSKKNKVVDLCVGEGSLLNSVQKLSSLAELHGTDIDPVNVTHVRDKNIKMATLACVDATSCAILETLQCGEFDLVIGNPPFKTIENTGFVKNITKEFNLDRSSRLIEAELFFLLLGIKFLKPDGYLAYILPDGLLTKISLSKVRSELSSNFSIHNVIEIPPRAFNGTEAKTHIFILKKSKNLTPHRIKLSQATHGDIFISKECFIKRGDYSYYFKTISIKTTPIKNTGATIIRGRKSKKELEQIGCKNYIHTSHLHPHGEMFHNTLIVIDKVKAIAGDIIITRVGTRSIGHYGVVLKGEFNISDCVFIIRCTDDKSRNATLSTLSSNFGKNWLFAISKGVGAKHITLADLYSLPIPQEY